MRTRKIKEMLAEFNKKSDAPAKPDRQNVHITEFSHCSDHIAYLADEVAAQYDTTATAILRKYKAIIGLKELDRKHLNEFCSDLVLFRQETEAFEIFWKFTPERNLEKKDDELALPDYR